MEHELTIRLLLFFGVLAGIACWERKYPRRPSVLPRWLRWYSNLGIVGLNSLIVRTLFPLTAVALALLAEERGWGILNNYSLPSSGVAIGISLIVLDFAIYLQHVLFHAIPLLWRLHRVHHTDTEYDVTTGLRFHPIEIILSMLIKLAVVILLGPPAVAVLIFEVLLNASAMFNHGNIHLPERVERWLRLFIVTPDMHRLHHSAIKEETNSNYGFNLPWWDRLLGTYRAQPQLGHTEMQIGLHQFRAPRQQHLHRLLLQPWVGSVGEYPINCDSSHKKADEKSQQS